MEEKFVNNVEKMEEEYSTGRRCWEMRSYKLAARHYANAIQFSGGNGINYDNYKTYYDLGIILCAYGDYQGAEYCYSVATFLDKEMQQNYKEHDTSLEGMAKLSRYYQILIVGYSFQFGHAVLDKSEKIKCLPNWKIYVEGYKHWALENGDQIPFLYPHYMNKLFPKEIVDLYLQAGIELAKKSMNLKAVDVEAMIDYVLFKSLPKIIGPIKGLTSVDRKMTRIVKAAEQGNPEEQYNLGLAYIDGTGINQNRKEGFKWLKKAAEQGLADAQYMLGTIYVNGFPAPKTEFEDGIENPKEGVKWFEKAAEQGNPEAINGLALAFLRGTGIAQNTEIAIELFTKSAEHGYIEAQVNLARCYTEGYKVEKDHSKGFIWWKKAAEQGDSEAQYYTGRFYHYGLGVEKDINEAIKWYLKSQKQGNKNATLALVTLKLEMEFREWKFCADQGAAEAQYHVGRCYYYGCGTEKDINEAIKWYTASAKQNNQCAENALKFIGYLEKSFGEECDEAVNGLLNMAKHGYDEAQNALGDLYYYGLGVEQNFKEAARWYARASANDFFIGQLNLANMYNQGNHVCKDQEKANELYDKASKNIFNRAELTIDNIKRYTSSVILERINTPVSPKKNKKAPKKIVQNNFDNDINKDNSNIEKSVIEKEKDLIDAGVKAKRAGNFEKSIEYYKEAVHLIPTNGNTYYALGKVLYVAGRYEESFKSYLLAYLHNANCSKIDLFTHSGHAILDAENSKKQEYANLIKVYSATIQGKVINEYFYDQQESGGFVLTSDKYKEYENVCKAKGKEEILRQAKIYARE